MGGTLVWQWHSHRAWRGTEAQGSIVEASVTDGGEAGRRAFVQLVVACQGVPSGSAASARVGH